MWRPKKKYFDDDRNQHYNESKPISYWNVKNNKIHFKHRSNRYQQYSSRNQQYQEYQGNKCNYSESSDYQYPYNYDNKNTSKQKQKQQKMMKQDPKYLHCPAPELEPICDKNIKYLKEKDYWIRDKSDGLNILCFITTKSVYFIDEQFNIRILTDIFYGSHELIPNISNILFSGTLTVSERNKKYQNKYTLYQITDCIAYNGQSIANQNRSFRQKHIDQFISNYNQKLLKYAASKNKLRSRNESECDESDFFDDWSFQPGDEQNIAENRIITISTNIGNQYQYTQNMKNEIINLCKSQYQTVTKQYKFNQNDDDYKNDKNDKNNHGINSILDGIELDVVSVSFLPKYHFKATSNNLAKLSQCIKYESNCNDDGYFFTDPVTGIKIKNDGIEFIPENNGYLMNRDNLKIEIQRIWKPKDLLTINAKIKKLQNIGNNTRNNKEMEKWIDNEGHINIYVFDNNSKKDVWFNRIEMGQNDNDENKTPFWNPWHLKQRSKISNFISQQQQTQKTNEYNQFIVECNYDFNKGSWSLLKLKLNTNKSSSIQYAQEVISRIEQCIEIKDLIQILK